MLTSRDHPRHLPLRGCGMLFRAKAERGLPVTFRENLVNLAHGVNRTDAGFLHCIQLPVLATQVATLLAIPVLVVLFFVNGHSGVKFFLQSLDRRGHGISFRGRVQRRFNFRLAKYWGKITERGAVGYPPGPSSP